MRERTYLCGVAERRHTSRVRPWLRNAVIAILVVISHAI
jgi:hypothetical protein